MQLCMHIKLKNGLTKTVSFVWGGTAVLQNDMCPTFLVSQRGFYTEPNSDFANMGHRFYRVATELAKFLRSISL